MSTFSSGYVPLSFFLWCGLKLVLVSGLMCKYNVEFISDTFLSACEEYPENSFRKYLDISQLNSTFDEDGALNSDGTIEFLRDLKDKAYPMRGELYKHARGVWVKTIYSLNRLDFCPALFSKTEFWAEYLKSVSPEKRKCPIEKGQKIHLSMSTNVPLEFPDRYLGGKYNLRIEIGKPGEDVFCCSNIFVNLYRH